MFTRNGILTCALTFVLMFFGVSRAVGAEGRVASSRARGAGAIKWATVMVIPARYTIVQFSFDILALRPVSLVSYGNGEVAESQAMHIWDPKARQWVPTNVEEYNTGAIFDVTPQRVVLIGSDQDLPANLISASSTLCSDVTRVPTLDIVTLVNALNDSLKFHPREWRWLAARHRLQLKDLNAERRRYGKYGKPGSKKKDSPLPVTEGESREAETLVIPVPVESAAPVQAEEQQVEKGEIFPQDK